MRMKTFSARSMTAAVRAIKETLGPDAVIMKTRRLDDGVEVTAAADRDEEPAVEVPEVPTESAPPSAAPEQPERLADDEQREAMRRELARLRAAGAAERAAEEESIPTALRVLRERLGASGVAAGLIEEVVRAAAARADGRPSPPMARRLVRQELATRVRTTFGFPDEDGAKRTIALLVGPTGVGKTTTLAKIAADAALVRGQRVGRITLATYRLSAVDQLETYATLLDLPCMACETPEQFAAALGVLDDCDLVLVDTAGRHPFARGELEKLQPFLAVAPGAQVHLTLAAPTRTEDMLQVVDRHAAVRPSHLVFTKLDESRAFGGLIDVQRHAGVPVSFLATGQRVPEDLEAARPDRLAAAAIEPSVFEPVALAA